MNDEVQIKFKKCSKKVQKMEFDGQNMFLD